MGTIIQAGVMGWPVAHSLSPALHGYWLKRYGINGRYEAYAAAPEDFRESLLRLRDEGVAGVNLTIPHKESAMALMDEVEESAHIIGAVNTVVFRDDGSMWATNSDAFGFAEHVKQSAGESRAQKNEAALVLGAGGAARAIVHALVMLGKAPIHISNRTQQKAQALADSMPGEVKIVSWEQKDAVLEQVGMVVNTTSRGMEGQPPLPIDLSPLAPAALVADIVYVPLSTPLLKQAEQLGHQPIDGLGMLMHQARAGFHLWFGQNPEVESGLREHLLKQLEMRHD